MYQPRKVFILENGGYTELSYEEFCRRRETNPSYAGKLFLPLYGMIMEVSKADYEDFYRQERRQKYIDERSAGNGDISYDMLTTEDFNGEDILVDGREDISYQVARKMMLDKLRICLLLLSEEERRLIQLYFYDNIPQTEISRLYGMNQSSVSRRITKILLKLKKLLDD